jgi:hypothetical protein
MKAKRALVIEAAPAGFDGYDDTRRLVKPGLRDDQLVCLLTKCPSHRTVCHRTQPTDLILNDNL